MHANIACITKNDIQSPIKPTWLTNIKYNAGVKISGSDNTNILANNFLFMEYK